MSQAEYPNTLWIPNNHFWHGRSGMRPRWIIIHGTAWNGDIDAVGVANYFKTTNRDTSTHYIVGRQGEIVQCVLEEDSAWGNGTLSDGHAEWWGKRGNPNLTTISIEVVKTDPLNRQAMTPIQRDSLFDLIAHLCLKWEIPPRDADDAGGITGHFSIDPVGKWFCPGLFPWTDLWAFLSSPTLDAPAAETLSDEQPSPWGSARNVLHDLPGFAGIVSAIDRAMSPTPWPQNTSVGSVTAWGAKNSGSIALRLLVISLGVGLLIMLFVALARGNVWMGEAGIQTPGYIYATSGRK